MGDGGERSGRKKHLEWCSEVGHEGTSLHVGQSQPQQRGRGFFGGRRADCSNNKAPGGTKGYFKSKAKSTPTNNQPTNQPTKTMESQVPFRTEAARGDAPPGAWLCCGAVAAFSSAYPDGHRGRILFRERPVGVRQLFFFFPFSRSLSPLSFSSQLNAKKWAVPGCQAPSE